MFGSSSISVCLGEYRCNILYIRLRNSECVISSWHGLSVIFDQAGYLFNDRSVFGKHVMCG